MNSYAKDLNRDVTIMSLVGVAHWASHFFQLVLPSLFLFLQDDFQVSFASLGLLTALLYGTSGLAQTGAGFLVDKFGARTILLCGLALLSAATLGYGLVPSYWMLIPLSIVAGLGNSVFHPADLSILTHKISPQRLGRGYAVHALCGNLGWAAAPIIMITITEFYDWRTAVTVAGLIGIAIVAAFLLLKTDLNFGPSNVSALTSGVDAQQKALFETFGILLRPNIISCFLYFTFLAAALVGIQNFGIPALVLLYDISLVESGRNVTFFLLGTAVGILFGGILADRTQRHDRIAISGMALAALILLSVATTTLKTELLFYALLAAGMASGITMPSRDMLVKAATPHGASGRIFGFVYSGLDLGSCLIPIALGWAMDKERPDMVFFLTSTFLTITIISVLQVRKRTLPTVHINKNNTPKSDAWRK